MQLASAFVNITARDSTQQAFNSAKKSIGSQVSALASLISGGLGAAGGAGILRAVTGLASEMETATLSFETLLGSAAKAKKLIGEIQQFAAFTPFDQRDIIQAGKTLLAFGFGADEVIPTLQQLGDVAAASGAPLSDLIRIFSQIKGAFEGGATKVLAQDFKELSTRGVPLMRALEQATGRVGEAANKDINFDTVLKAFRIMTSEGGSAFRGMERLSKSLSGQYSNLVDTIQIFATSMGNQLLPALTQFVSVTTGALNMIRAWDESTGGLVSRIAVLVTGIATAGGAVVAFTAALNIAGISLGGLVAGVAALSGVGLVLVGLAAAGEQLLVPLQDIAVAFRNALVENEQLNEIVAKAQVLWQSLTAELGGAIGILEGGDEAAASFADQLLAMTNRGLDFVNEARDWGTVISSNWDESWELMRLSSFQAMQAVEDFLANKSGQMEAIWDSLMGAMENRADQWAQHVAGRFSRIGTGFNQLLTDPAEALRTFRGVLDELGGVRALLPIGTPFGAAGQMVTSMTQGAIDFRKAFTEARDEMGIGGINAEVARLTDHLTTQKAIITEHRHERELAAKAAMDEADALAGLKSFGLATAGGFQKFGAELLGTGKTVLGALGIAKSLLPKGAGAGTAARGLGGAPTGTFGLADLNRQFQEAALKEDQMLNVAKEQLATLKEIKAKESGTLELKTATG